MKKLMLVYIFYFLAITDTAYGEEVNVSNTQELEMALQNSSPHSIVRVKAGEYNGRFVITKPIHLIGEKGAKLIGPNEGNVLTIEANDVIIEGFQIEGSGSQNAGIYVKGNRSYIHHNIIQHVFHGIHSIDSYGHRFDQNMITSFREKSQHKGYGIYFVNASNSSATGNLIYDTQDGIYVSYSDFCQVKENQMIRARYGVHTMDSRNVLISQNNVKESVNGLMIMQSFEVFIIENVFYLNTKINGSGMYIFDTFDSKITSNIMMGNDKGMILENAKRNRIEFNIFQENNTGIELRKKSDDNLIYLNNFYQNTKQIISDPNNQNQFSRDQYGNYFDDHESLNINGDEIVDFAYKRGDIFYQLVVKEPYLQIFHKSPSVELWNRIEKFTPIPTDSFVIDPYPLVQPAPVNWDKNSLKQAQQEELHYNTGRIFYFFLILIVSITILWKLGRGRRNV